jgi:hypothetical protein
MDAKLNNSGQKSEVIKFLIPNLYADKLRKLLNRQMCGLANRQVGIFFLIDEQHPFGGGSIELSASLATIPYRDFQKIRKIVDQAMKASGGQL